MYLKERRQQVKSANAWFSSLGVILLDFQQLLFGEVARRKFCPDIELILAFDVPQTILSGCVVGLKLLRLGQPKPEEFEAINGN